MTTGIRPKSRLGFVDRPCVAQTFADPPHVTLGTSPDEVDTVELFTILSLLHLLPIVARWAISF